MVGIAWTRRLRLAINRVPNLDQLEVLPLLSVVMLLLHAPNVWYLQFPLTLLCVVGLVFRRMLRSCTFWYLAATMVGATVYLNWESADNHKYLLGYWCLALCCVFSLPDHQQRHALSLSSRWLIGLCMAWAVFWKAVNPGYLDGSFFEYTLLTDERFADFARSLSGVTQQTLSDNRHLLELLTDGHLRGLSVSSVVLSDHPGIAGLAQVLTWWTILIEAALAVAFLWPPGFLRLNGKLIAAVRNSLLLLFGMTTYAVAPVVGFGWMLMLLGLAQCEQRDRWLKLAYVGTFMLILVYAAPVSKILMMLIGRMTGACECG